MNEENDRLIRKIGRMVDSLEVAFAECARRGLEVDLEAYQRPEFPGVGATLHLRVSVKKSDVEEAA